MALVRIMCKDRSVIVLRGVGSALSLLGCVRPQLRIDTNWCEERHAGGFQSLEVLPCAESRPM